MIIKVKVPATTANLGAGFDTLGIALSLYNYVYFSGKSYCESDCLKGTKMLRDNNNLMYKSAARLFEMCGEKLPFDLKIHQTSNIPITRGLGSSSACIVAGLMGANRLLGVPLNDKDILKLATELEGHPDNVAPAIFGGMVDSVYNDGEVYYVKHNISSKLKFIAIVPNFKMSTNQSRLSLPSVVSHEDAVFNVARSTLFVSSIITGKFENLSIAVNDRLHQPYRLKLIDRSNEIFDIAYRFGAYAVYLSGSGPTIIAICDKNNKSFFKKIRNELNRMNCNKWRVLDLNVDNEGASVEVI